MANHFETRRVPEVKEIDRIISIFNRALSEQRKILLTGGDKQGHINLDNLDNLAAKELETLAAMRSLPTDPLERILLLEEYKKKPDGRFSDSALSALEALDMHGKEVRSKLKKDWRDCLTYPELVKGLMVKKLDEIALLIDMPEIQDRYSWMSKFLTLALDSGLLTNTEYADMRNVLAKEL